MGSGRIDDPEDYHRLEVEAALKRGIRVIPVLVQRATMPAASELPETLKTLARRHALELSDTRWTFDVDRLSEILKKDLGDAPPRPPPPEPPQLPPQAPPQPPPQQQPPQPAVQSSRTNGLAVASLVLSVIWFFGIASVAAILLGNRARRQIDSAGRGQAGRGLATAGVVLGWIGIGIAVLALFSGL